MWRDASTAVVTTSSPGSAGRCGRPSPSVVSRRPRSPSAAPSPRWSRGGIRWSSPRPEPARPRPRCSPSSIRWPARNALASACCTSRRFARSTATCATGSSGGGRRWTWRSTSATATPPTTSASSRQTTRRTCSSRRPKPCRRCSPARNSESRWRTSTTLLSTRFTNSLSRSAAPS